MPSARGSEWHRWDPHLHAPGTLHADEYPAADGWARYLQALESGSPAIHAIGVTDYCVTRSYELVKAAKEQGRLKDCSLLFPNVELRLNTGTVRGNFVNIHLLVSPDDPNHVFEVNRFLGRLMFSGFSDKFACTPEDLRRLGRLAAGVTLDDETALRRGAGQFKVSLDNLLESYRDIAWAQDNILIAVSANADGTSGVRESGDATLREEIEKAGHLMFASSTKQRDFWVVGYFETDVYKATTARIIRRSICLALRRQPVRCRHPIRPESA